MKTKQAKSVADNLEKYIINGRYSPYKSDQIRQERKELALKHMREGTATNFEKSMCIRTTTGTWSKKYDRMINKVFNLGLVALNHYSPTEQLLIQALKES